MSSPATSLLKRCRPALAVAAMLAAAAVAAQVAPSPTAAGGSNIDASGNYRNELQACKEGRTGENQATCQREARNAQADKQRGRMPSAKVDYEANALARCNVLQGDDKAACQARMMGHGQVSGSVAGGGLLRQLEVVQVPPGATQVRVEPKTADAVMVLPAPSATADAPVKVVPVPAQPSGPVVMEVPPH